MDGHLDAALLAGGDDGLKEVDQVLAEPVLVHVLVGVQKGAHLGQALGLPAGQGEPGRTVGHGVDDLLWIVRDVLADKRQGGRAVRQLVVQVALDPVEHGHEVVADDLDALRGQVADGLFVRLDMLVAKRRTYLDVIRDANALDDLEGEALVLDHLAQLVDALARPDLAGRDIEQRAHDAAAAGDLANLLQGDLFFIRSVPAEGEFHVGAPCLLAADGRAGIRRARESLGTARRTGVALSRRAYAMRSASTRTTARGPALSSQKSCSIFLPKPA